MLYAQAAARFAHFAAICALFGLAAFPFYAGAIDGNVPRRARAMLGCGVLALVSGAFEFLASVAGMGDSWGSALDPAMLTAAITDTRFGRVWVCRLGLAALIVPLCAWLFRGRDTVLLIAATVLLTSVALTGHSAMPGGGLGAMHQAIDGVHLLAAGWWIGGLLALLLDPVPGDRLPHVLRRFSKIGTIAVPLLALSGVFKTAVLVAPLSTIFTTGYGLLLLGKLALFGMMVLIALSNRFQIVPHLIDDAPMGRLRRRLVAQVSAEFALGLVVLAIVGLLGAMSPPAT